MLNGEAVRSCLIFAAQVDGCSVRTVEGLAPDGVMRDIHHAFLEHQGLQCGFCTPGILMTVAAAMEAGPLPQAEAGIRDLLSGNICRCTGYQGIVDAVMALAAGQRAMLRLESTGTGALRPSPERPSLTSFPGNGGPPARPVVAAT